MKTFKDFIKPIKDQKKTPWHENPVSWENSTHSELRNTKQKLSWDKNPVSWENSTHSELRSSSKTNESYNIDESYKLKWIDDSPEVTYDYYRNEHDTSVDHFFKNVKAKTLTPEQKRAIYHYTTGSSSNTEQGPGVSAVGNKLLDEIHKNGGKVDLNGDINGHPKKEVWKRIKTLVSSWDHPKNTNHRKIITYSGIPHHVGKQFHSMEEGDEAHLARNTSTSIDRRTAFNFGKRYLRDVPEKDRKRVHMVEWHIHPGAGLPVADHSGYAENEVALRYGTRISKKGTYTKRVKNSETGETTTVHVHQMEVHPEFKNHKEN